MKTRKREQLVAIFPNALCPYLPGDVSSSYFGLRTPICYYTERGEEVIYDPQFCNPEGSYLSKMIEDRSSNAAVDSALYSARQMGQPGSGGKGPSKISNDWTLHEPYRSRIWHNRGGGNGRSGKRGFGASARRGNFQLASETNELPIDDRSTMDWIRTPQASGDGKKRGGVSKSTNSE
jgi:hypothetical protein